LISRVAQDIAAVYARRHETRGDIFGEKPYANYGYWTRNGMGIEEACDALTDAVAQAAEIGPGDRVLEVGCGYGASAVFYMRRYTPASVLGIDVTDVRVDAARAYAEEEGLADRIRFERGDATRLGVRSGTFTVVVAIECAFHFQTREDFFREAARVLAPGGRLGMTDIIPRRGADLGRYRATVHFPIGSDGSLDVAENIYDADGYTSRLEAAGFEQVRIEPITDFTLPPFAAHLERAAQRVEGERRRNRMRAAAAYRDYLTSGLEYVLVSARRPLR